MNRSISFRFSILLFLLLGATGAFAAFPVTINTPSTNKHTTIESGEQTFNERRIPHLLGNIVKAVTGEDDKKSTHLQTHKTGWQGLLASGCAILALLTGSLPFALLLGTAALVFGILGLNKAYHTNTGFAVAGVIVGGIVVVIGIILLLTTATILV